MKKKYVGINLLKFSQKYLVLSSSDTDIIVGVNEMLDYLVNTLSCIFFYKAVNLSKTGSVCLNKFSPKSFL